MEESKTSFTGAILAEARRQHAILSRGVAAVYPGPDRQGLDGLHHKLAKSLTDCRPLKVKFGMDPTAPDLHSAIAWCSTACAGSRILDTSLSR